MKKLKLTKEVIATLNARQMNAIEGGFTFSRCPLCNAASTIIGDHCTDPGIPESGLAPQQVGGNGNCTNPVSGLAPQQADGNGNCTNTGTGTSPMPSVFDCSTPQGDSYCTCPP